MAPQSASRIEALCLKMAALYGSAWTSQYGDDPRNDAARTWAAALAGLTPDHLATGLRACVVEGAEFPPSAPRFRAMCLGIPSFEAVNLELVTLESTYRSAFSRLVWSLIDGHAHRHARAEDAKRIRRDAYEIARERVLHGEPLPPKPIADLDHQPMQPTAPIPRTREERIAYLSKVLQDEFNPVAATRKIEDIR